jgi:hypothetical protein
MQNNTNDKVKLLQVGGWPGLEPGVVGVRRVLLVLQLPLDLVPHLVLPLQGQGHQLVPAEQLSVQTDYTKKLDLIPPILFFHFGLKDTVLAEEQVNHIHLFSNDLIFKMAPMVPLLT